MTLVSSDDFKLGMRHIAAAVNVISTMENDEPRGMLATAVCSVCAEPPTLLVCINKSASMHAAVVDSGCFCVSVLDERQLGTASKFLSVSGAERFNLCDWDKLQTGAPAINGALVNFDATVVNAVEAGSHTVFFGEVAAMRFADDDGRPLLYHNGCYSGLSLEPLS